MRKINTLIIFHFTLLIKKYKHYGNCKKTTLALHVIGYKMLNFKLFLSLFPPLFFSSSRRILHRHSFHQCRLPRAVRGRIRPPTEIAATSPTDVMVCVIISISLFLSSPSLQLQHHVQRCLQMKPKSFCSSYYR